ARRSVDAHTQARRRLEEGEMIAALTIAIAILCGTDTPVGAPQTGVSGPQYEVYAVRYATIPDFPVSGLIEGAEKSRKLDIAMMVWLVRGGGHNILVDTGFYRPQFFKNWKVNDFVRPDEAVARLGVKPEEITD